MMGGRRWRPPFISGGAAIAFCALASFRIGPRVRRTLRRTRPRSRPAKTSTTTIARPATATTWSIGPDSLRSAPSEGRRTCTLRQLGAQRQEPDAAVERCARRRADRSALALHPRQRESEIARRPRRLFLPLPLSCHRPKRTQLNEVQRQ